LAGPFCGPAFRRLKKVPRCKSETVIPAHQNAGYTHQNQRQHIVFKRLKVSLIEENGSKSGA
jgi:hypothetical protein